MTNIYTKKLENSTNQKTSLLIPQKHSYRNFSIHSYIVLHTSLETSRPIKVLCHLRSYKHDCYLFNVYMHFYKYCTIPVKSLIHARYFLNESIKSFI